MINIIKKQREYFMSGKTISVDFRIKQLKILKQALQKYEKPFYEALKEDLGKNSFESHETELGMLYLEIKHVLKHIKKWASPKAVNTPFFHFPSKSWILSEPLGVVLIMSPWNYPLQLTLAPLISAMTAGNCVVIKPSRYSEKTSAVLEDMIKSSFPPEYISIFQGGSEVNKQLLEFKFDHIFFTGSPAVGRVVMEAAAKSLTPITLELGGKSPCIVDKTA
ncbi:MAG: Aldehyde Dehydrogenase, partial [Clostridia bacterium]|nr:Aldehyde Dehydrogenase [Clostridia bacterium]